MGRQRQIDQCRFCGATIRWAGDPSGERIALDIEAVLPIDAATPAKAVLGLYVYVGDGDVQPATVEDDGPFFSLHRLSCPQSGQYPTPAPTADL